MIWLELVLEQPRGEKTLLRLFRARQGLAFSNFEEVELRYAKRGPNLSRPCAAIRQRIVTGLLR
eukprot:3260851-Rhodomonas_salina.2